MNISQLVDAEIFRLMQVRKLLTGASMRTGGRKRGGKRAGLLPSCGHALCKLQISWRDGRVAEGARLESVFRGNSNVGSNPTLSAII